MRVGRATVVVEAGDSISVWMTPSGRVVGRVSGVLDVEAESPEVLAAWARRVMEAAEAMCPAVELDADRHEPGRTRLGESEWHASVPWSDVRDGDEVRHRGRWLRVRSVRPIGDGHPMVGTHRGCLDVVLWPCCRIPVEPSHEVEVRFPRVAARVEAVAS